MEGTRARGKAIKEKCARSLKKTIKRNTGHLKGITEMWRMGRRAVKEEIECRIW